MGKAEGQRKPNSTEGSVVVNARTLFTDVPGSDIYLEICLY